MSELGEARGLGIYRRRGWGFAAPPELSGSSARRRAVPGRGGEGPGIMRPLWSLWTSTGARARTKIVAWGALWLWPHRARACFGGSSVGERQGEVMGDETKLVERCDSRRQALR